MEIIENQLKDLSANFPSSSKGQAIYLIWLCLYLCWIYICGSSTFYFGKQCHLVKFVIIAARIHQMQQDQWADCVLFFRIRGHLYNGNVGGMVGFCILSSIVNVPTYNSSLKWKMEWKWKKLSCLF